MAKYRDLRLATYVRTHPRAKLALDRVVTELARSESLSFRGKRGITQEGLVSASWLLLEALGPAEVERLIAPHVAHLDELLLIAEDSPPPPDPVAAPPADAPARRRALAERVVGFAEPAGVVGPADAGPAPRPAPRRAEKPEPKPGKREGPPGKRKGGQRKG